MKRRDETGDYDETKLVQNTEQQIQTHSHLLILATDVRLKICNEIWINLCEVI